MAATFSCPSYRSSYLQVRYFIIIIVDLDFYQFGWNCSFYFRKRDDKSFNKTSVSITSYRLDNLTASSQHIFYVTASNENGESRPSETLMAWTDPAYEPIVEVPTVHPMNIVLEGGSMTVICVAVGTPMPTVSLYIAGRLIRQEKTRHMVAVLSNVTRTMNHITCYANNGYGQTAESSRRIIIGRTLLDVLIFKTLFIL